MSNTKGLTNYDIVQYQLKYLEKEIIKYYKKGIKKIVIIHGKGEGVLRKEVYSYIKKYDIDIEDASFEKYGVRGATSIYIRNI